MTINKEDFLNSILESLSRIEYIKAEDIPNIELYMDQVTKFMDSHLEPSKRYPEDKILTKTMINNYAKNNLLPPPTKKKYSKDHMLMLIFIYYFKNILSINDIQNLLNPLTNKYFETDEELNLETIYNEVFGLEKEEIESLKKDIAEKFKKSTTIFEEAKEIDQDYLQKFSFICMLAFDVYVKKQLIEKIIDLMPEIPNNT
ncbi:DUF1836 domain-containing protein [Anaerosacchariphilus polymeriproducens]|uniref:DUF1836 domain-containing protein n=1 Tax=Anaerosacchariphilus polymeriproducens TaxID=1812858 RepID=A0A371AW93_9FIRM|nr:DUF1836 domain-containing protein [Anaerosacchariphilus polymeriproducens]RDU23740.1 DUF1836 domain-containing protein [Anaerosacchariphilus polymeriproducens]